MKLTIRDYLEDEGIRAFSTVLVVLAAFFALVELIHLSL